jgi:outer membrane receptor protein involved in Fe transport
MRQFFLRGTLSAIALTVHGMAGADESAPALANIVVKGEAIRDSRHQPYTVNRFSQEDIRTRQVSQPEQLLREVPGMEVRGLGYGGVANAMTLRGFSGGGHGGDIGFVMDGIPLNEASSHADGYADLNVVIPLELAGLDIFKGPVSALYGNFNRAGVVALRSRKGGDYREMDARIGSHGTMDVQGAVGAELGAITFNGAAQLYRTDGYRPQSRSERATVAARASVDLARGTQLALSGRVHRAQADGASVITQAQYGRRDGFFDKNPNVQNDGADKDFATLRADLSHTLTGDIKALAFVYATRQTFTRLFTRLTNATTWRQRMEDYDRDVLGYGVSLNGEHRPAGKPLRWVLGLERHEEDTHFRYADALSNGRYTAATTAAGGSGTLNRLLSTDTSSAFGQVEWALDPLLRPTLGLRHDRISGGCKLRGPETRTGASAQCNDMPDFSVTTPKAGVRSTWVPGLLEARVSLAEGYALPSDAAKFTAGLAVEPTKFRQRELGLTLTPGSDWLIDLSHFRIDSRDEVALIDEALFIYGNVGKTRREGVELEVRYHPASWFEASAALARVRTKVIESLPMQAHLEGAELTGVAREMATVSVTLRPAAAYAIATTVRHVGRYAINVPSSATSGQPHYGGYTTLDLMASYEHKGCFSHPQRFFVQVANLTDERYATSAGITSGVRTYNPAPARTFMVGSSLSF